MLSMPPFCSLSCLREYPSQKHVYVDFKTKTKMYFYFVLGCSFSVQNNFSSQNNTVKYISVLYWEHTIQKYTSILYNRNKKAFLRKIFLQKRET